MKCPGHFAWIAALSLLTLIGSHQLVKAEQKPDESELDAAIATFRNVDPRLFKSSDESREPDAKTEAEWEKIQAAADIVHRAGARGAEKAMTELRRLDERKEKDDFFRLSVAAFLYEAGGPAEAQTVAAIWDKAPLDLHYDSVFVTARKAALTQDPRVLPMLVSCLRDQEGLYFVDAHYMQLHWPITQMFLWGTYGPKGLPALHEALKTAKDPVSKQSAMMSLSVCQYLPALETVRLLAKDSDVKVRAVALEALGYYGHPRDFGQIAAALTSSDLTELEYAIVAAMRYGDLRAAAMVAPLVKHPNETIRGFAFDTLLFLPSAEGWRAAIRMVEQTTNTEERLALGERSESALSKYGATPETFLKMGIAEQQALVRKGLQEWRNELVPKPGEKKLTHEDLLKAAAEWKRNKTIRGGQYGWVESRHVLAAATDKDIDLLLDVRAQVMQRLSDECMDDVRLLDDLVQRLGRTRYRTDVGVTEKVE